MKLMDMDIEQLMKLLAQIQAKEKLIKDVLRIKVYGKEKENKDRL